MAVVLRARVSDGRTIFVIFLIIAAIIAWLIRAAYNITAPDSLNNASLALIWLVSFASIAWTSLLAVLEKPKTVTDIEQKNIDSLRVVVLIPAYNEDEQLLIACIKSVLRQTRLPDHIEVVDDGSTHHTYATTRQWLATLKGRYPLTLTWTRTKNKGKRHAQGIGIKHDLLADVYITVDSDTVLDPDAIAEGLKPFADPDVQSVGGICLPINVRDNLLTRFTGLWETIWQLTERSAQSTMNSVTVNSGVIAFYRGDTIRQYLSPYLNETFFGREVKFSDDSMLTLYSMIHGKTVQQPTSIAFSAVPNRYSHHLRRYMRWMRGSFIRTWWRFKYLPMNRYIYWLHLFRWMQFVIATIVFVYLAKAGVLTDPRLLPYLIAVPVLISYAQALRYFIIQRNDESDIQQILTFLTAPVAMLWLLTVLRVIKWYSYATVVKNGWGTRGGDTVEVSVKV